MNLEETAESYSLVKEAPDSQLIYSLVKEATDSQLIKYLVIMELTSGSDELQTKKVELLKRLLRWG